MSHKTNLCLLSVLFALTAFGQDYPTPVVVRIEATVEGGTAPVQIEPKQGADGDWGLDVSIWPAGRTVYVSSAAGDDAKDGLTVNTAKKTIAAGVALLRDGSPDRLLLRMGDTFADGFGGWMKSGLSEQYPMTLGAYGAGNPPLIQSVSRPLQIMTAPTAPVKHLRIENIEFRPAAGAGSKFFRVMGTVDDLEFVNCDFNGGFETNLSFKAYTGPNTNVRIRGCKFLDACSASGTHSQGLFVDGTDGLLIEDCLFDHNGWREGASPLPGTIYNHNLYVQQGSRNVTVRGCVSAGASSHGIMVRPGGIVSGNVVFRCPIGIQFGGGTEPVVGGIGGVIDGNVVLEGTDIRNETGLYRGQGIGVSNVNAGMGVRVVNNIIANCASRMPNGQALYFVGADSESQQMAGVHNVEVADNIIYHWLRPVRVNGAAGTQVSRVNIHDNYFEASTAPLTGTNRDKQPVSEQSVAYQGNIAWEDNVMWSNEADPYWFTVAGSRITRAEWVSQTGAQGTDFEAKTFSNPASVLDLDALRECWGEPGYTAADIIRRVKEGFGE